MSEPTSPMIIVAQVRPSPPAPASPPPALKESQNGKILAIIFGTLAALGIAAMIVLAVPGINILTWKISLSVSLGLAVIIAGSIYFSRAKPVQQTTSTSFPSQEISEDLLNKISIGRTVKANLSQMLITYKPDPQRGRFYIGSPYEKLGSLVQLDLLQLISANVSNEQEALEYYRNTTSVIPSVFTEKNICAFYAMIKPILPLIGQETNAFKMELGKAAFQLADENLGALFISLKKKTKILSKMKQQWIEAFTKTPSLATSGEAAVASPQQSGASASSSVALPAPVSHMVPQERTPQEIEKRVQLGKTVKANFSRLARGFTPQEMPEQIGKYTVAQYTPPVEAEFGNIIDHVLQIIIPSRSKINADTMQRIAQTFAPDYDAFTHKDYVELSNMFSAVLTKTNPGSLAYPIKLGERALELSDEVLGSLCLVLESYKHLSDRKKPFLASLTKPIDE